MNGAFIRRSLGAAFLVALCGAVVTGCGGAHTRYQSHMARGQSYYSAGNYEKASVEFRNAMQIEPKNLGARLWSAQAAERTGHPREAFGLYQSVVDAAPDNIEARANLARLLIFGGAPDRGLTTIAPALARQPNNGELLTLRAMAKFRLKDSAGALVDVERALSLSPLNEQALALRAGMYQQTGERPKAVTLIADAVQKLPNSTDLRNILAQLYADSGDMGKAEEQLRALVQLQPAALGPRNTLARFYVQLHRPDDARHVLEDAVAALPQNESAKLVLVDFVSASQGAAEGERLLRKYVAAAPDDDGLALALGALLAREGSLKDAIATYQGIIARNDIGQDSITARERLAAIALAQSRPGDAAKLVAEILKQSPRDDGALAMRGQMSLDRKDYKAAITDFRAVVREQPQLAQVQRLLATAYVADGEPDLALQSLRTAVEAVPGDPTLRINLAELLMHGGHIDQALTVLEDAAKAAPRDPRVLEALTRAHLGKPDLAAARADAEQLTQLAPTSAVGPFLAGVAAQGQMQLDEAQKDFQRAVDLQPKAFDALDALVQLQMARGQSAQALALVKDHIDHDPKNPLLLNLLGGLYAQQKNYPQAIAVLTATTTAAPNWPVAYRNLALAKYAAGDAAGGLAAYQAAMKIAPADPQYVSELAEHYVAQGKAEDAIDLYEQWHEHNPQVQVVAANLARLLVNYHTDAASLDRARDLTAAFATSDDGRLLDANGWVHFKRGDYADALAVLQRAAQKLQHVPEVQYHLGMAEMHAGESDQARNDLQAALSASSRFPWADDARKALSALNAGHG